MLPSQIPPPDGEHLTTRVVPAVAAGRRLAPAHSDFHYYWRIFYGRRWLLVASAVLGLTLSALYTLRQPRLYQAQATVEFKSALPPGKDLDIVSPLAAIPPAVATRLLTTKVLAARVIKTERDKGHSWFDPSPPESLQMSPAQALWSALGGSVGKLAALARAALGGARSDPTSTSAADAGLVPQEWEGVDLSTIGRYYSHLAIRPEPMTSLADIIVTHPNPGVAAALANAHAEAFIDLDLETKVASLSDAQSLVRQQLNEVQTKLESSRKALGDYQREHGILSLPKDNTTITRESLQQLNKLLTKAQGDRIVAQAALRNAAAMSADQLADTLPDPSLKVLRDELLGLRTRYEANQRDYGRNHPDMVAMRARLDAVHEQLRTAGVQARDQLRAVFAAAEAKEHELRANFEELSKAANDEDRQLVPLLILQRDVEANQGLYATLLQQAKEADLKSSGFGWSSVKLVDRAAVPNVAAYPRTARNLQFGLIFGLLGGVLVCLLIERLDTRIHTPDEVTAVLQLPTFGVVPDFRRLPDRGSYGAALPPAKLASAGRELVTLLQPTSLVSEAYRSIRTNLLFSSAGAPPRTILVTSSQSGEGKTVTVLNLAVSLATSGGRVLIVDADLRKPGCHRPMQVAREPGLSDLLVGQIDLASALVLSPLFANGNGGTHHHSAVYLLPAGTMAPNPAELLGSAVMNQLLETLKEQFEFVLIDSPPVLPVTDSVVMATKTDGVLLVVRGGEWGHDVVQKALAQLDAVRARVLGAVLNCIDVTRGGSSYYYYRHHYGAYYGSEARKDDSVA